MLSNIQNQINQLKVDLLRRHDFVIGLKRVIHHAGTYNIVN